MGERLQDFQVTIASGLEKSKYTRFAAEADIGRRRSGWRRCSWWRRGSSSPIGDAVELKRKESEERDDLIR
ncbi:hypothetical protein L1887_27864 [Cichorium endivia]|nr:hypothetical protein L1887_27864 [Cichorium endivia]